MFYRRLLKTMMQVFEGDYNMFHRVRLEARRKILESRHLTDPVEIQNKIFEGEECRDFLQVNVMQGHVQDNGNFRLKARPAHGVSAALKDGSIK